MKERHRHHRPPNVRTNIDHRIHLMKLLAASEDSQTSCFARGDQTSPTRSPNQRVGKGSEQKDQFVFVGRPQNGAQSAYFKKECGCGQNPKPRIICMFTYDSHKPSLRHGFLLLPFHSQQGLPRLVSSPVQDQHGATKSSCAPCELQGVGNIDCPVNGMKGS